MNLGTVFHQLKTISRMLQDASKKEFHHMELQKVNLTSTIGQTKFSKLQEYKLSLNQRNLTSMVCNLHLDQRYCQTPVSALLLKKSSSSLTEIVKSQKVQHLFLKTKPLLKTLILVPAQWCVNWIQKLHHCLQLLFTVNHKTLRFTKLEATNHLNSKF